MLNVTQNIPVHYDTSQHFSLTVTENGKSVINYTNNKYTETYRITGYFRSRNFRITHAKLNFEGYIFVHFQLQDNLSIRDLLSKSFIFEGVALFEIFENKTPSKITRYTVHGKIQ